MTPREHIYVDLVAAGMERAYSAAHFLEERNGHVTIDVTLANCDEDDASDPAHLPDVRFEVVSSVGADEPCKQVFVGLHHTGSHMRRVLEDAIDRLTLRGKR